METFKKENMIVLWFVWHFYQMPKFLFSVWKNFMVFGLDFFSAPLLLSTLFSPWKKYHWRSANGSGIMEHLNTFISNIFSRLIGAIIRSILIVLSFLAQIFILIFGSVVMVSWFLLPFLLIVLLGLLLFYQYGF